MKKIFFLLICTCLFHISYAQNWSQVGGGTNGLVRVLYSDSLTNKIYIGGNFQSAGGIPCKEIATWDGSSFDSLSNEGAGGGAASVFDITRYQNYIVAAGSECSFGSIHAKTIGTWNGLQWDTFPGVIHPLTGNVNALRVANGNLFVGGWFNRFGSVNSVNAIKWNGMNWDSLNTGIYDDTMGNFNQVRSIYQYGNTIYFGGLFLRSGQNQNVLEYDGINFNTTLPYDSGLVYYFLNYNNELYVAQNNSITSVYLKKWDGIQWTDMGMNGVVNKLLIHDNLLYAVGNFTMVGGGIPANKIAYCDGGHWHALGSEVFTLGGSTNTSILTLTFYNNELFIGGTFNQIDGLPVNRFAKYTGTLPVSVSKVENSPSVSVFPNPVSWILKVNFSKPQILGCKLELLNVLGEKVMGKDLSAGTQNLNIDVSALVNGFYILKLMSDEGVVLKNIVKQ